MARFISKLALAVLCFSAADAKIHLPRIPHLPNMEAEMAIAKLVTSLTEMSANELVSEMKSIFPQAPVLDSDKDEDVPIDSTASGSASLPVVILHGMGDSCFNPGMASITNVTGVYLNTYSVCIPGGSDLISDTLSGFLVNMDKNVDNFAKAVAADPKLSKGFYAIGFSQGNLILRGYLQRYNNPVAVRVLHVHGILQGVSAFPRCPDSSALCQAFSRLLGSLAYNSLVQGILFQADYFRDPELVTSTNYKTTSQIANWNGENDAINPAYKENFLKTESLTHIKALSDSVVDPRESEWWGTYAPGSFTQVVPMEQTSWYVSDSFGLKTMHTQGRLSFNTSTGDHLRFTKAELFSWIEQAGFTN